MANWCENVLRVTGDANEIERFKFSIKTDEAVLSLDKLHPMPKELEGTYPYSAKSNWYDWRIENWGTRWDVDKCKLLEEHTIYLKYRFRSRHDPPTPWLKRVSKDFPNLKFSLTYEEESDLILGKAIVQNGSVWEKWLDMYEERTHNQLPFIIVPNRIADALYKTRKILASII